MKYLLTVIFLFACATLLAQVNLVKNPSFEQYSQCPSQFDEMRLANFWSGIDSLGALPNPPPGIPEYCNYCSSTIYSGIPINGFFYQYPKSGKGMAQVQMFYIETTPLINNYYRDYLQGRLFHTLITGKSYCVTFYVVYEELSDYAISNVGAYFDNGSIDNVDSVHCALPQTAHIPQVENTTIISDTLNWTKIEGTFTATGTEKFITIGNFRDKAHTNYTAFSPWPGMGAGFTWYLIDDVSVVASDAVAYAGHDTAIGFGDSVYIGLHDEAMPCTWTKLGSSTIIHDGAGMWVKPTATTKYIVKQTLCGVSTYDTVTITVWPQSVNNLTSSSFAKVFPNPVNNLLHIHVLKPDLYYQLQNMLGITVLQGELQQGESTLSIETLPTGIYLLELADAERQKAVIRVVKE
jgi:Secretion system C-terminal sorting domain